MSDSDQQQVATQSAMKVITDWDADDKGTYTDLANKFATAMTAARREGYVEGYRDGIIDARGRC